MQSALEAEIRRYEWQYEREPFTPESARKLEFLMSNLNWEKSKQGLYTKVKDSQILVAGFYDLIDLEQNVFAISLDRYSEVQAFMASYSSIDKSTPNIKIPLYGFAVGMAIGLLTDIIIGSMSKASGESRPLEVYILLPIGFGIIVGGAMNFANRRDFNTRRSQFIEKYGADMLQGGPAVNQILQR